MGDFIFFMVLLTLTNLVFVGFGTMVLVWILSMFKYSPKIEHIKVQEFLHKITWINFIPVFGLLWLIYNFMVLVETDIKKYVRYIVYSLPVLPIICLLVWG